MGEKNRREENEKYVVDNFNVESFLSDNNANDMLSKQLEKSIQSINSGEFDKEEHLKNIANENKRNKQETQNKKDDKDKSSDKENTSEDVHCTQYLNYKKSVPKRTHNSAMSIVTVCVIVLFASMVLYIGYYVVFDSDTVINNTYNNRSTLLEKSILRGNIYSDDNQILAQTVTNAEGSKRYYPYGDLFAHVVGRFENGKSGLESKYDFTMLTTKQNELEIMINEFQDMKSKGNSIKTTLNIEMQQVAYDALQGKKGAVVAINPQNGKIMAMVSTPSYDPNYITDNWEEFTKDEDENHVLLNRASQGLYAPGSTFKIITALEYIRENPNSYESYEYECKGDISVDDYVLHCHNNKVHGSEDLIKTFAESCNTSFANIGMSLDIKDFQSTCVDLLFNSKLPFDFEYSKSSFKLTKSSSDFMIAQSSIGQGEVLITPLHLGLIASAIANDGVLMKTHILDEILDDEDNVVEKIQTDEYKRLMTKEEAKILKEMMKEVVEDGTATSLNSLPFEVAGKTGTAEYNKGQNSHAWFVCMAPYDNPEIVLSIIVEDGGTGTEAAVPIAKKILEQFY